MSEQDRPHGPDVGKQPDPETIPAEKTVEGLGDVQISGEAEEDSPTGGASEPGGHGGAP